MSTKPYEISPDEQDHFRKALEIARQSGAPKSVIAWLTEACVDIENSKIVDQHFITALTKHCRMAITSADVRKIREHLRELGVSAKLHVDPPPSAVPNVLTVEPYGKLS